MEKVEIWKILRKFPFNTARYSIIEFKEGYYLMDHEQNWWRYVFPMISWLIPRKVMNINLSKLEINTLLLDKKLSKKRDKEGNTGISLVAIIGGGPLVISFLELLNINVSVYINLIIVLAIMAFILIWKIRTSKNAVKILDVIGKENLSGERILIFPSSLFQVIKVCFFFVFLNIVVLISKIHFLLMESGQSNPFLFLGGAMFFLAWIHMDGLLMIMGKYRIKILD